LSDGCETTVWVGVGFAIHGVWTALLQAGKSDSDGLTLAAIEQVAVNAYNNINLARDWRW
jgi:hypothetical protein